MGMTAHASVRGFDQRHEQTGQPEHALGHGFVIHHLPENQIGKFIHDPLGPDDGLSGPVIGKGSENPGAVRGGNYAPYLIERWTKVNSGPTDRSADIYYVLSTWNPYVVVLMNSRLRMQ